MLHLAGLLRDAGFCVVLSIERGDACLNFAIFPGVMPAFLRWITLASVLAQVKLPAMHMFQTLLSIKRRLEAYSSNHESIILRLTFGHS